MNQETIGEQGIDKGEGQANAGKKRRQDGFGCKAWRRANLGSLCRREADIETSAGMPARGSSKRMAARLELAPAALSNMVHGVKNIGDEAARSIEAKLGEAPGSLDIPPLAIVFESAESLAAAKAILAAQGG